VDPDLYIFRIIAFCSYKFLKIANYFILLMLKKEILSIFQKIIEIFTQKSSQSAQEYRLGIRDPG